uniref:Thiamine transporter 2 n=1 Tax=Haemonchus contortus TaxID=6289 RepID=A0A7I4YSL7_HAECO
MRWQVTTFILCTYGFLKSFRPTEPFLYQYEHETLNISEHVLNAEVYPIWTYSYMITLIPVLLLTDLLLYKAVIVFEAVSYIVVWSILVFCSTVFAQQMLEIFYGWATATEIAYFAFIYVKVSKEHFRKATSLTRGAILLGSFLSYAIAQLIILLKWGNYQTLNIISLTSVSLSLVFAIALPAVPWKSAYEKKMLLKDVTKPPDDKLFYKDYVIFHFKTFIEDLKGIYGNSVMLKWSLWWALATCGYLQIGNYTQTLWGTLIPPNASDIYNGLTEALCPLISLPAVLLVQHLRVDWSRWGELCLAVCSTLNGLLLLLLSQTNNLFVMYAGYIGYRLIYESMITITQFNLAEGLVTASYGLVFGMNTFMALVMQSLLTLVVVSSVGFSLSIRPQFVVYSAYHFVVASIFAVSLLLRVCRLFLRRSTQ